MNDWQLVMDHRYGGFAPGFDPSACCQFKRHDEDRVATYRMADQSPYFNIAGLYWRSPA